MKQDKIIFSAMFKSTFQSLGVLLILFIFVYSFTSKLFNNYVDEELARESALFQHLLNVQEVILESDIVIDHLDIVPQGLDVIVLDTETRKPVYVEINDNSFVFSHSNAINQLLDIQNVDVNKDTEKYVTIKNKRLLIGSLVNKEKRYMKALIRDISDINYYFSWLSGLFAVLSFLIIVWHFYNSNNIIKKILLGLDEIVVFATEVKGKNLAKRIEIKTSNESIKNLISHLNSMLDRVEESFIKINDFTSNVSHELKTPIMSIKSLIEVELTKERTNEEYQDDLVRILEEVNWLNEIIQKLLIFTKNPESLEQYFKPVKIEKMIIDLCEFMEILTFENDISLNCNLEKSEVEVLAEISLLRDVFSNLISNSIKYNKVEGEINISSFIKDDMIGIKISDTGIGIKEENLSKITTKFYREDQVRTTKKSGSGLGLSIVIHLLNIHGGSLEIESIYKVGSTFTVFLPIKK